MTLSGLLLLIGVVVDDAIVVLENIHRHIEAGETDHEQAAIDGTNEVVFAVLAATLTLVCIFATVVFMEGMIGVFMRSFAVVVSVGVVASLFVSLSLTPALCARFLKRETREPGWLGKRITRFHQGLEALYRRLLSFSLNHRVIVLGLTAMLVLSTGWFMGQLGSEFFPGDDESRFLVKLKTPLGSSIDYMETKIDQAELILADVPEVQRVLSTVGSGHGSEVNEATLNVSLTGQANRNRSQQTIMNEVRTAVRRVPGVEGFVSAYSMFGSGGEPFVAFITGPDLYRVAELAGEMEQRMKRIPGMGDVRMELKMDRPQLYFDVDRNRAQALGISAQQIGDTVRVLAGGADIAKYNALPGDGERYDVRLAARRDSMQQTRDLENVYLQGPANQLLPLGSVVEIKESLGPATVNRFDLAFAAEFNSTPEMDLGQAVNEFKALGEELLPPGYQVALAGQAEELGKSVNAILFVFATGLILIYMVLASQFNSFLQPVLVMLAQPLAIVGGVVGLWVAGHTLNIYSMIGLVLLIGLVSKKFHSASRFDQPLSQAGHGYCNGYSGSVSAPHAPGVNDVFNHCAGDAAGCHWGGRGRGTVRPAGGSGDRWGGKLHTVDTPGGTSGIFINGSVVGTPIGGSCSGGVGRRGTALRYVCIRASTPAAPLALKKPDHKDLSPASISVAVARRPAQ